MPSKAEGMPHASAAFEDVLRRAADQAARRRVPAGLHDLLRTILGGGPGSPAAALLMRAAADPQRLERWRDAPLRAALIARRAGRESRRRPSQPAPAAAEALLARLDHMEGALRSLQAQVAADRQALGDLLRDVQSGLQALRSEGTHAVVADRSQAIAGLLESKLGDLGKSIGALGERFAGLDDIGKLGERLGAIDKLAAANHGWPDAWDELRTHMRGGRGPRRHADPGRRQPHRRRVLASASARPRPACSVCRRRPSGIGAPTASAQIALEASVRAHLQGAEEAGKKHERDLGEVYQALVKLGANQQTLGDNFTAWRIETGGDIGIVNNGLQKLEQTMLDLLLATSAASCRRCARRATTAAAVATASSAGFTAPATSSPTARPPRHRTPVPGRRKTCRTRTSRSSRRSPEMGHTELDRS